MVPNSLMLRRVSSAQALRLGSLGALLLASCSTLVGIEDPVPRDCEGDGCEAGNGGAPLGGKSAMPSAGSANPSDGGVGGEGETPKLDAGAGGVAHTTPQGGAGVGGEGGTAPAECEPNEVRCATYQPQDCVNGVWTNKGPECALACVDGACQSPPSCSEAATPLTCMGSVSCCETTWIPAGESYAMGDGDEVDEISYQRFVSGFYLDRFEVTVDRFQDFLAHYTLPADGAGAHPLLPGSGWQEAWEELPHIAVDGRKAVAIDKDDLLLQLTEDCGNAGTWNEGDNLLPVSCVNWYAAFAFCVYDGGRLPTEAEWNYAAAFGSSQRPYPWSVSMTDFAIDGTNATFYDFGNPVPEGPTPVGSHELGRGGFVRYPGKGHDDLAGNVFEWTLDQWLETPPAECVEDCAVQGEEGVEDRVMRGGHYAGGYDELRAGHRASAPASLSDIIIGFRCARDLNTSPPE
jgi:formylglycine-generating enzyme